jgi:hypothetical protein
MSPTRQRSEQYKAPRQWGQALQLACVLPQVQHRVLFSLWAVPGRRISDDAPAAGCMTAADMMFVNGRAMASGDGDWWHRLGSAKCWLPS